ncbi:MAG TPA: Hsp20/alpha crystallin family protein [Chryseosolibacter sp.]|nr:Hsp20/alpha crystallin family protein [Chryseosolibacter sp.]
MSILRYSSVLNDFAPTSFSHLADRFFNESMGRSGGFAYSFVPKVDIIESENAFEIHLAVPGMNKEDFKIDVKENHLTISGERKLPREKEEHFRSIGTQYGAFKREFVFPETLSTEKIQAKYNNGILEVVVPKEEKKFVKTTIKVA